MGIKIVVYTHTDYKFVWPLWFGQTQKYMSEYSKIIFVNEPSSDIPSDYHVIVYDSNLSYTKRVSTCLNQLPPDDIIIFHHEDMFLYDAPDHERLNCYKKIIESNSECLIKLIRAGNGYAANDIHPNLYFNPAGLYFSIQPTMVQVQLLDRIYTQTPGNTIWEFESNANHIMHTLYSLFSYDNEPRRGISHYDSKIYPYIATAVVKGNWNLSEYNTELTSLFDEYKINNI